MTRKEEVAKQYDHIALAVKDLDKALRFFLDKLGAILATPKHHSQDMNMYIAEVVLGLIKIELIQDADANGPVSKYIEKEGEGLHHISILVDNIHQVISDLEGKGLQLIGKKTEGPGDKWAYISPKESFGALIQYWEYD
jgi:methylmalonyl-CoA/ethylmalonyl-CoA epimerase